MNPRIKELMEQASTGACYDEPNLILMNTEIERFAEQIIKECATMFTLTHTDEQYPRRIDKTILKHFGITE